MKVEQVYKFVNTAVEETLGKTGVVQENLQNIVDVGKEIDLATGYDAFVKSLINHIGKVIFVIRQYTGSVPSVLMDGWEYGSILEKVQGELPIAVENQSWELNDLTSYDPNIFYQPKVSAKFYNSKTSFEIRMSYTEKQVKQSFSSREQMNGFISMLFENVNKALTVRIDELIMRTINNMIGETLYNAFPAGNYNSGSTTKAINLLYLYNNRAGAGEALTYEQALYDEGFLRFASTIINKTIKRMSKLSVLYNMGGKERFTAREDMHIVMLSDFVSSVGNYLYNANGQFGTEYLRLPQSEEVPYWQGSGTDYSVANTSQINITTASGHEVNASGIIGVAFDRNALGVCNQDRRVYSNFNPVGEFTTNFWKFDCSYFNDGDENFVVFYMA